MSTDNESKIQQHTHVLQDYFFKSNFTDFFKRVKQNNTPSYEEVANLDFSQVVDQRLKGILEHIKQLDIKDEAMDEQVNKTMLRLIEQAKLELEKNNT